MPVAGCVLVRFRKGEEGDRPDQSGTNQIVVVPSTFELGDLTDVLELKLRRRRELGNQVVVVGVEPFCHFEGGQRIGATGEGEVALQTVESAVALRDRA